jgi:uncharacterized protein (DUF983 family)
MIRIARMAQLEQLVRQCPSCGSGRLFEQHHQEASGCPDSADGQCPEWSCTACGAALLIDVALQAGQARAGQARAGESGRVPNLRDRVA